MSLKKTMVIGLGPNYNYNPDDHSIWTKDNTKYASNHGASLISRTLIDFFQADYIDDFSKVEDYKAKYDLCVIAFATHVTTWRNVTPYADFVEKLDIKTVAFSLGIQDYSGASSTVNSLHPSFERLLKYVIKTSGFVGVRGPYTASVLIKSGFNPDSIIPFGCPTLFKPLNKDLKIYKKTEFKNPLIVFHRTMADLNKNILDAELLGQDFLDEVVFDDKVDENQVVKKNELEKYKEQLNGQYALDKIKEKGAFYYGFEEWYKKIGKHDFVLGARLHGCIAALIQGIPAVMIARDIRVEEIAKFYKIPFIKYADVGNLTIEEIYDKANFEDFNDLYPKRYNNFLKLMDDLKIVDHLSFKSEIPKDYIYTQDDLRESVQVAFGELAEINSRIITLEESLKKSIQKTNNKIDKIINVLKKIPGVKILKGLMK